MPIINDDPQAPTPVEPNRVEIAEPQFQTVVVDTEYIPSASLLTHIEGSSWTTNYFSQILTGDSAVQGQQPTLDPLYQQYTLIKDFELKVNQPLTNTQDQQTMTMRVTGSATVYPMVIPNIGDMFIADVGDGREGLFRITQSERRSIFRDTCYIVDYELISFAEADRFGDLYSKVVNTLQFVRDFLTYGQNPLLQLEDWEVVQQLSQHYQAMVNHYFNSFISRKFKTLCLPGQELPTYDPFIAQALPKWFSTWDAERLRELKVLNVADDPAMDTPTLWSVLSQRDAQALQWVSKHWGLVSARAFERNPLLEGIYWTGIDKVVYPTDPVDSVDQEQIRVPKALLTDGLVLATPVADTATPPLIKPAMTDDFYVFSEAFYAQAEQGQSQLELQVGHYLRRQALDNRVLLQFAQTYPSWGALERFYYLPIVLLLIKASIRSL